MREKNRKIHQNENSKRNIRPHFFKTKLFLESGGLSYFLSSSISKFSRLLTFCLEFGSFFLQFLGRFCCIEWEREREKCDVNYVLLQTGGITGLPSIWRRSYTALINCPLHLLLPSVTVSLLSFMMKWPPVYYAGVVGGLCPLCRRRRVGHCVAPVSGILYCYSCIVLHVRDHQKCPVTGLPLKEEDLVRVFPPGEE